MNRAASILVVLLAGCVLAVPFIAMSCDGPAAPDNVAPAPPAKPPPSQPPKKPDKRRRCPPNGPCPISIQGMVAPCKNPDGTEIDCDLPGDLHRANITSR